MGPCLLCKYFSEDSTHCKECILYQNQNKILFTPDIEVIKGTIKLLEEIENDK